LAVATIGVKDITENTIAIEIVKHGTFFINIHSLLFLLMYLLI
jgi:hypothetical protein